MLTSCATLFLLLWSALLLSSLRVRAGVELFCHPISSFVPVLTHMVDLLLEDPNIQTVLAGSAGAKDDATLEGYISEVFRALYVLFGALRCSLLVQASTLLCKALIVSFFSDIFRRTFSEGRLRSSQGFRGRRRHICNSKRPCLFGHRQRQLECSPFLHLLNAFLISSSVFRTVPSLTHMGLILSALKQMFCRQIY
jgi:hypothetical protein